MFYFYGVEKNNYIYILFMWEVDFFIIKRAI